MNKLNFHVLFSCAIYLIINITTNSLFASQYGPGLYLGKPYDKSAYLHSFAMNFSYGSTDKAYNEQGKVVPFLQQYGTEDLLKRFIDPTLDCTDTQVIGTVDFSGIFNFQRCNLSYHKNIHHDLFIGMGTVVQNLTVHSICQDIKITDDTLTSAELQRLDIFDCNIPFSLNTAGMYTTYLEVGWNKKFENFKNINFLELQISTAFCTPQLVNQTDLPLLQYPLSGNIVFSYPIRIILATGITPHLKIGFYSLIIPLQGTQITTTVNNTTTNNHILLTESTTVKVYPQPIFSNAFYIEATNFTSRLTGTFGCGYTYGMEWTISALDQNNFSDELINADKIFAPWNIMSLLFQIDYSFKNPRAPHLSLYYVLPVSGSFYPKINIIGGCYNLIFSYKF